MLWSLARLFNAYSPKYLVSDIQGRFTIYVYIEVARIFKFWEIVLDRKDGIKTDSRPLKLHQPFKLTSFVSGVLSVSEYLRTTSKSWKKTWADKVAKAEEEDQEADCRKRIHRDKETPGRSNGSIVCNSRDAYTHTDSTLLFDIYPQ